MIPGTSSDLVRVRKGQSELDDNEDYSAVTKFLLADLEAQSCLLSRLQ